MINPPYLQLNVDQLFTVFGFFLMILISLELLESLRAYISEDQIHVEVIFTIALIAVARKVLTMKIAELPALTLIGLASVLLSLAIGYYLIKKAHGSRVKNRAANRRRGFMEYVGKIECLCLHQ